MSDTPARSLVHEQFAAAFAAVGVVRKASKNDHHGYQYRGIDDVMNVIHGVLAEHELFYVPRVVGQVYDEWQTSRGKRLQVARLDYEFEFYTTDGSSFIAGPVVGQSADTDDKAPMQALSQSAKYALVQVFCLPTEELDADGRSTVDENGGRREPPSPEHQELLTELDGLLDTAESAGVRVDREGATAYAGHSVEHARAAIGNLTRRLEDNDSPPDTASREASTEGSNGAGQTGQPAQPGSGEETGGGRTAAKDTRPDPDTFDPDATWLTVDHLRKRLEIPRARMLTHARLIVDRDELDGDDGRIKWEAPDDVGPDAHPQVLRGLQSWLDDVAAKQEAS